MVVLVVQFILITGKPIRSVLSAHVNVAIHETRSYLVSLLFSLPSSFA